MEKQIYAREEGSLLGGGARCSQEKGVCASGLHIKITYFTFHVYEREISRYSLKIGLFFFPSLVGLD